MVGLYWNALYWKVVLIFCSPRVLEGSITCTSFSDWRAAVCVSQGFMSVWQDVVSLAWPLPSELTACCCNSPETIYEWWRTKHTDLVLCKNIFQSLSEANRRLQQSEWVKSSRYLPKFCLFSTKFPLCVSSVPLCSCSGGTVKEIGNFILKRL